MYAIAYAMRMRLRMRINLIRKSYFMYPDAYDCIDLRWLYYKQRLESTAVNMGVAVDVGFR